MLDHVVSIDFQADLSSSEDLVSSLPFLSQPLWSEIGTLKGKVRLWAALGCRKDSWKLPWQTLFVYLEYRDQRNSHRYIMHEVRVTAWSQSYWESFLCQVELPGYDAEKTAAWNLLEQ
ncbi:hypothetical protein ACKC9G_02160 [Pokkaliibacter sp. CJK22405]|uniref:hypothetical protein n=1 Tax=Pokkaliibacter sp. CJK22405 TaxID=3384615 RepID=UPI003984CC56